MSAGIPVIAASQFDPGRGRVELTMAEGLSLAEIVRRALPGAACTLDPRRIRVALVTNAGSSVVGHALWHAVRPKPGVRVVIRIIPGKGALRSVLSIVVAVAAAWAAFTFAGPLAGALGWTTAAGVSAAGSLISAGITLVGSLLINALVPPVSPDQDKAKNTYTINSWRNRYEPDGAVPVVLGTTRYAPPFAATSYSEIVGDQHYIRALFLFGEGELQLTDFRIGETSIEEYDEVELEVRRGAAGDLPVTLYPRQVIEEAVGVELTRPLPRDDSGEIIDNRPAEESPIVRTTAADAKTVSVIFHFPAGLIRYYDGDKEHSERVEIRIEQRRIDADEWQVVEPALYISGRRTDAFYRRHSWTLPSRGRWQIRLTMLTPETTNSARIRRCDWVALQSTRPEYPLATNRPMALVAVRVKATHQLSGQLDNLTALARRVCLDWDKSSSRWIKRASNNPASLYRLVLQHPSNPKRVPNSELDLELLEDWHEFCASKGLAYNRVLDQAGTSLRDVLTEIAAAGRATPRHDGTRWGVVIDRPQDLVVDHIGPRNSWGFKVSRTYTEQPHALVVTFNDETNDYKQTQRVIPRPGYTDDIDLTEALSLPGITDPDLIYREALRRWYEILYRPDTYELIQDGVTGVTTRGDLVRISHDTLSSVQVSARVVDTQGVLMLLDEEVEMLGGVEYNLRFRRFDESDVIGTSQIRSVVHKAGRTNLIELTGPGYRPKIGDQVFFGPAGKESFEAIVTKTEVTEDMCTILHLVNAAPEIDTLTDAAVIPAWSGRVGAELDDNLLEPSAPRWKRIYSAVTSAGRPVDIDYLIAPGTGAVGSARFEIDRRRAGFLGWSTISIPVASGGGEISGYESGDSVELRARAISAAGIAGPYGPTITHLVGKGGSGLPVALDEDSISVTALLGAALVQFAVGSDPNTRRVQIYRSMSPTLDREIDAVGAPITVSAGGSYSKALGDTTRANKLSSSAWTAGGGWTVSGGTASHDAGMGGELSQSVSLGAGKFYRFGLVVSGASAGSLTPRLTGGSTVAGDVLTGTGLRRGSLQAVTGNNEFGLMASYDFDGSISSAVLYQQTASCLAQGTHYLWLEPQTADGLPGPVTGPFIIEVI